MKTLRLFLACLTVASAQELSIIAVSPTGQLQSVDQTQMISVTFSEPMVAVQSVPADAATGPLSITPAVPGKYRWQGTSTLSFIPNGVLKHATAYTVTVPAGVRSIGGKTLKSSFEWKFISPLLGVIGTIPSNLQKFVELDHAITLSFNQKVDPSAVSSFVSVEEKFQDGRITYPKYVTLHDNTGKGNVFSLRTVNPFSPGSLITVRIKAGAKGVEGELGMGSQYAFSFSTFRNFEFLGLEESKNIDPESQLRFMFSNPVSERDLYEHLRFSPEIEIPKRDYYREYPSEEYHVDLELKAGTMYTGFILPGMKDRFGQVFKDTVRFTFNTRSYSPVLYMASGVGVMEAYGTHKYSLAVLNVDKFHVQMAKVRPEKIVPFFKNFDFSYGSSYEWAAAQNQFFQTLEGEPDKKVFDILYTPNLVRDVAKLIPVNLDTVLGSTRLGTVILHTSYEFQQNNALLQVTNLGITAKFSPQNNLIWVTNLKDASPAANTMVELRNDSNRVLWKGVTDNNGAVYAPGYGPLGLLPQGKEHDDEEWEYGYRPRPRLWILVTKGDDFAFTNSELDTGIEPWSFGISYNWNPKYQEIEGSVFTDRGLYKGGERVDMKAVVRQLYEGSWRIPKGDSVRIIVRNPRNEEIFQRNCVLSMFGSCASSLTLSPSAPLGYYSISLLLKEGNRWSNLTNGTFRVEAFRPAEFDVTAMMDEKSYIVGDSVSGLLSAKYLFGAPLKNAEVTWRLSVTGMGYEPPGFDGYYFAPLHWLSRYSQTGYREIAAASDGLDEQGVIRVRSKINVGEVNRTTRLMLEGDVTSATRQVISGRASVTMHGAEYYVGIGQSSTFVSTDTALTLKFIAVTPEGKFIPGRVMEYRTYRRIWRSVRKAEVGGRYYWSSEVENILADSIRITSGKKAVERIFTPKDPGFYYTEVRSTDDRGNLAIANSYFYVSGTGYVPWERSDDDRIELIVDKTNYKPGDVARIIVKNPYEEAEALVSIEREGIMHHFSTTLTGSAPEIRIPIKNQYLPNVFVSVVLLHGRTDSISITKESDIGRPSFKIGYANLSVTPIEKKIVVTIATNKNDFRPGDSVAVTITTQLSTGGGVSSEVALSVADLGVLNLINYKLPDLFNQFYRERGLSVTTTETRAHLIEQRNYDEKGEVIGGGGAEKMMATTDAEGIRKDFRASAYWNPSIITDAKGKATVRFKLPDNLTAFQLMAAAHSVNSDFGYGEHSITVSKPLLLQASLPRFVRVGDTFEGGVVVMNYSDNVKNVKVISSVEGLSSSGTETLMVVLKAGESKEVRRALKAETTGTAKFVFRAYAEGDYDGMQWLLPVEVPRLKETVATSSTITEQKAQEMVAKPADIVEGMGSLDITLASTALVGLEGSVQYLFDYPYGCLEQKMSKALPIILAADMVSSFNIEILKGKDHRKIVQDLLDEVPQYQGGSGGFYYWKGDHGYDPYPYLTAYTMYGLVMAKKNGYRIDQQSFQRAAGYLREELSRIDPRYGERVSANTRSFILYVLAENGSPDFGYMEKLFAQRATLPLEGRAFLLKALVRAKGNDSMIETLVEEFRNMLKISPTTAHFEEQQQPDWWWFWYSQVKTTAIVAQALIDARPGDPFLPKIVRWIMDRQKSGRWRTTQENMYVAAALSSYFKVFEKEEPQFSAEVRIAGEKVLSEIFKGRTTRQSLVTAPLSTVPAETATIDITKAGQGRLYYTLRMHYYPKKESVMKDEGFSVQKSVEHLTTGADSPPSISIGSIARITLTISSHQERSFVVVDDPVPAGFEIINTSFQTTARNLNEQSGTEWYFNHRERKDDRALFFADHLPAGIHQVSYLVRVTSYGTFQMPATRVEQMYEPEVFGQTASTLILVK